MHEVNTVHKKVQRVDEAVLERADRWLVLSVMPLSGSRLTRTAERRWTDGLCKEAVLETSAEGARRAWSYANLSVCALVQKPCPRDLI